MPTALHVLLLEDQPADAELVLRQLLRADFAPEWLRVDNEADYRAALHAGGAPYDVILADFRLPSFDRLRALPRRLGGPACARPPAPRRQSRPDGSVPAAAGTAGCGSVGRGAFPAAG